MGEREETGRFENCEIVFWRGYVKCAFYAVPQVGEPVGSPFFRSREHSPVKSGKALEAHRALVEQLEDDGWEPVARGRAWYALTLRRRDFVTLGELPLEEEPVVHSGFEGHAAPPPPPELEAEPVAAPRTAPREPAPVPSTTPLGNRSPRQLALLVGTAALIALAIALGFTLFGANSAQGKNRSAARPTQQEHLRAHRNAVAPVVSTASEPAKLEPTTIVISGRRGNSWVEAKADSASGKSLFSGVVSPGQTIRITAPVVWVTFGAAGNLDIRVNGKAPVPGTFNGTITALIAHGRVRSA